MGIIHEGKNLLTRSKFFTLRVDPLFWNGFIAQEIKYEVKVIVSLCKHRGKKYEAVPENLKCNCYKMFVTGELKLN